MDVKDKGTVSFKSYIMCVLAVLVAITVMGCRFGGILTAVVGDVAFLVASMVLFVICRK